MSDYLVGVGLFIAVGVGWALVQAGWGRTFPESAPGGDALAGRSECGHGGCAKQRGEGCPSQCERTPVRPAR